MSYEKMDDNQKEFYDSVKKIYKKSLMDNFSNNGVPNYDKDPLDHLMNKWIDQKVFEDTGKPASNDQQVRMLYFDEYEKPFDEWIDLVSTLDESRGIEEVQSYYIGDYTPLDVFEFVKDVQTHGW